MSSIFLKIGAIEPSRVWLLAANGAHVGGLFFTRITTRKQAKEGWWRRLGRFLPHLAIYSNTTRDIGSWDWIVIAIRLYHEKKSPYDTKSHGNVVHVLVNGHWIAVMSTGVLKKFANFLIEQGSCESGTANLCREITNSRKTIWRICLGDQAKTPLGFKMCADSQRSRTDICRWPAFFISMTGRTRMSTRLNQVTSLLSMCRFHWDMVGSFIDWAHDFRVS